jgi:hypothetical protein
MTTPVRSVYVDMVDFFGACDARFVATSASEAATVSPHYQRRFPAISGPIGSEGEWQLCGLNHASPREWQTWAIKPPFAARLQDGEFAPEL